MPISQRHRFVSNLPSALQACSVKHARHASQVEFAHTFPSGGQQVSNFRGASNVFVLKPYHCTSATPGGLCAHLPQSRRAVRLHGGQIKNSDASQTTAVPDQTHFLISDFTLLLPLCSCHARWTLRTRSRVAARVPDDNFTSSSKIYTCGSSRCSLVAVYETCSACVAGGLCAHLPQRRRPGRQLHGGRQGAAACAHCRAVNGRARLPHVRRQAQRSGLARVSHVEQPPAGAQRGERVEAHHRERHCPSRETPGSTCTAVSREAPSDGAVHGSLGSPATSGAVAHSPATCGGAGAAVPSLLGAPATRGYSVSAAQLGLGALVPQPRE